MLLCPLVLSVNWHYKINKTYSKLASQIVLFRQLKTYFSQGVMDILYYASISTILDYASKILRQNQTKHVTKIRKQAAIIILWKPILKASKQMFK